MARPLRVEFEGGVYHVTARGIERRALVRDDDDRARWMKTLEDAVGLHRWRVFAFVLMDNHFHLLIETPDADLCASMRDLNGNYGAYFNRRHRRSGHLFQGRYKAHVIENEGHWLEVSRYVHLNPVRARAATRPEAWDWSSFRGYVRKRARLAWMDYETVLADCGGDTPAGRRQYRAFVDEGVGHTVESPFKAAAHSLIVGTEEFVDRVAGLVASRREDPEVPRLRDLQRRDMLEKVVQTTADVFGADRGDWRPGRRENGLARAAAAYLARQRTNATATAIGEALGFRRVGSVAQSERRILAGLADPSLAAKLREIEGMLELNA